MPSLQGVRFYFSTLPGLKEERTLPHPSLRCSSQRIRGCHLPVAPSGYLPSLRTRTHTYMVFFCCRTGVNVLVMRGGGCMDESRQREGYVIGSFFIRAYLLYKSKRRTVWFIQYVVWEGGVRVWGLIRILRGHSSVRETVQDESILKKTLLPIPALWVGSRQNCFGLQGSIPVLHVLSYTHFHTHTHTLTHTYTYTYTPSHTHTHTFCLVACRYGQVQGRIFRAVNGQP